MQPSKIKNHNVEKCVIILVLNLTEYVRNVIFLFYQQKIPVKFWYLELFGKKSILAYISL